MKKNITSRQLQAKKTKNRLYKSAVELMDNYGYENVTIEEISNKAGVSVGTFYHYYDSKSDVFIEIYAQIDEFFKSDVESQLTHKDVFENIRVFLKHYADFNNKRGYAHVKLLFETHSRLFTDKSRYMYMLFKKIIEKGQADGQITKLYDAEYIADYMLLVMRGVVYYWILYEGSFNMKERLYEYTELMELTFRGK